MGIDELKRKIIELKHKMNDAHRDYQKAHTAGNHNLMQVIEAAHNRWSHQLHTAKAMLKLKVKSSMSEEKQAIAAEMERRGLSPQNNSATCSECFDTGHRFGFGAPCSKGCMPGKEK